MYAPRQYRPEKKKPYSNFLALEEVEHQGPVHAPPVYAVTGDAPKNEEEEAKDIEKKSTAAPDPSTEQTAVQNNKQQQESEGGASESESESSSEAKSSSNKRGGRSENPPQFKLKAGAPFQFKFAAAPIQMKAANGPTTGGGGSGSGGSLPEDVKAKMEGSFGTSFDDVKVTANSDTAKSAGALAFAQGNNIHFAPGQYNPESKGGQELLGHELAHVVQQRQGRVQANAEVSGMAVNNDHSLEAEADSMGAKAAQFKAEAAAPVENVASSGNAGGAVQMKMDPAAKGADEGAETETEEKDKDKDQEPRSEADDSYGFLDDALALDGFNQRPDDKKKEGDDEKEGSWTDEGGGKDAQTTDPKVDPKKEPTPKEDLTKLDDNEKYMRALDEVGKIGDAAKGKGLGKGVLDKKLKAIKAKYALQTIEMVDGKDESIKVHVRQKDKDNSANLIEVKLLSPAELLKQFNEAVADLELKLKLFGDPKTGAVTKAQAEAAAHETDLHFEVIDGVTVTVEGDQVVIKGDVGVGAPKKMASKPLAKGMEPEVKTEGKTDSKIEVKTEVNGPAGQDEVEEPRHVEEKSSFSMNGAPHTLTIAWDSGVLMVKMASLNPGDILGKLDREIIARTSALAGAPPTSILADLQNMRSTIDLEINKCRANITKLRKDLISRGESSKIGAEVAKEERFLIEYINHLFVDLCRKNPTLTDFVYKAYDVSSDTDKITNIVNTQLEKHVGAGKTGDGHACSAYAAECVLGWYAKQGNNRPQLHKTKLIESKTGLNNCLRHLDELISNAGLIEIKTNPTYLDKFGVTWAVYEKAKSEIAKCDEALADPSAYLSSCGQYSAFSANVADRLANDQATVQFIKLTYGLELGNPATITAHH